MPNELTPELHIKKSSSAFDTLRFAQEHGVKLVPVVEIVDDDQRVIATADLADSWQQLIDDCDRSLRTVDQMVAERDRLGRAITSCDELVDRIERVLEANDGETLHR